MPESVKNTARIDEHLVKLHEEREKVRTLLCSVKNPKRASANEIRILRRKIRKTGPDYIKHLLKAYLDETATEAAFLVLNDLPEAQLQSAVSRVFQDPELSADARIKLFALGSFDPDRDSEEGHVFDVLGAHPDELMQALTGLLQEMVEPEELAMMWISDFGDSSHEEKLAMINYFIQSGPPSILPALEIEASSDLPEIRRVVAYGLRNFPSQEALRIVDFLCDDVSPTVRYDASNTKALLARQKELPWIAEPPKFWSCQGYTAPQSGICSILYAVMDSQELIKFCSVLIDTWGHGIEDIWGNVGVTQKQFNSMVKDFMNASAEMGLEESQLRQISREEALYLITEAEKLSVSTRSALPPEYQVWSRLFRHEQFAFDATDYPVKFRIACEDCLRKIRANRHRSNLFVEKDLVLCRKCLRKERTCKKCGQFYSLEAVHDWDIVNSYRSNRCMNCLNREP